MRDGPARAPCAGNGIGADGARAVCDGVGRLAALTSLTLHLRSACVGGARQAHVRGATDTHKESGGKAMTVDCAVCV